MALWLLDSRANKIIQLLKFLIWEIYGVFMHKNIPESPKEDIDEYRIGENMALKNGDNSRPGPLLYDDDFVKMQITHCRQRG